MPEANRNLAGIANRRRLMEAGQSEVQRAFGFNHPLSLLILDRDDFKKVNDPRGHMKADLVMCAVAGICAKFVRSSSGDIVGRIGGQEFAVVLPETAEDDVAQLAERRRHAVARAPIAVDTDTELACTPSIGVSSPVPLLRTFSDLLLHADRALYRAKQGGRNCVCSAELGAATGS